VPLGTPDPLKAVKTVQALNLKYERQWERLRADPTSSPAAAEAQAVELLLKHGLIPHAPDQDEARLNTLFAPMEAAREAFAGDCDEPYRTAHQEKSRSSIPSRSNFAPMGGWRSNRYGQSSHCFGKHPFRQIPVA